MHTGRAYSDHQVFRLGDMTKSSVPQIFEVLEQSGYSVGAVSPMNTVNRLETPAYFIPDPWTDTPSAGGVLNKLVAEAISQAVNDNSQSKITVKSMISLIFASARFVPVRRYWFFIKYALSAAGTSGARPSFSIFDSRNSHGTLQVQIPTGSISKCRSAYSASLFSELVTDCCGTEQKKPFMVCARGCRPVT